MALRPRPLHHPKCRKQGIIPGKRRTNEAYLVMAVLYFAMVQVGDWENLEYRVRAMEKSSLGDYAGAIADYTKAIELDPKDAVAYFFRGIAKHKLRQKPREYKG